jgi:hypothetical protein
MSCRGLSRALERYGIRIAAAVDGDDMEDGELTVTGNVHVRVPTLEGAPCVIFDPVRSSLRFYPPRDSIAELARDIRDALDVSPCAFGNSSLH